MIPVRAAIEYIIEHDPLIAAAFGRDENDEYKIYEMVAPQGTEPPWGVWQIVPGAVPEGHFHDLNAIGPAEVQFRVWALDPTQAWQLWDILDEAIGDTEVSVELLPYTLLHTRRMGMPSSDLEVETRLYSVQSSYRFAIATNT